MSDRYELEPLVERRSHLEDALAPEFRISIDEDDGQETEEVELRRSRWLRRKQNTDLIGAILDSNIHEVERLLKCGASPIARCQQSMATASHLAALRGHEEILCTLLKECRLKGITTLATKARDTKGRQPHHLAAAAGSINTLKILLKEEPTLIDSQAVTDQLEDEFKMVPEKELDSYLHDHSDVTKLLMPVTEGSTALHIASKHSFINIVDYLISKKARMDVTDKDGLNPLDVAGLYADPTIPGTIISAAVPAEFCPEDADEVPDFEMVPEPQSTFRNKTFSETAAANNTVGTFQSLIKGGAKFTQNRIVKKTQLHIFVEQSDINAIEEILNSPLCDIKDLINATDDMKRTPVHLAVELNLIEPLKLLLEKDSSALNSGDIENRTPLHIAVEKEWTSGIEVILDYEPDMTQVSKSNETVLHIAAKKKNPEILKALLERANKKDVNVIDKHGFTPLLRAIESGDVRCVEAILDFHKGTINFHRKKIKFLHNENSLIHVAVKANAVNVLRLIKKKLESEDKLSDDYFNNFNKDGLTPLHLAVLGDSILCLDYLLDFGGNVNVPVASQNQEHGGGTVIHIAAKLGRLRALETILNHYNCQDLIKTKDDKGREPLILAAFNGHSDCAMLLLKNGANLAAWDSTSNKTALDLIYYNMPHCIRLIDELLDSFITKSDKREDSEDFMLTLNYKCLLAAGRKDGRQLGIIESFIKCSHEKLRHKLFLHPLTESFLFFKWKKLQIFFHLVVSIFVVHIFALTGLSLARYVYDLPAYALGCSTVVFVMVVPIFLLEILNARLDKAYLIDSETWVKWSVILSSTLVAILPDHYTWLRYLTSVSVLLAWIQLLFLLARNPRWVHVLMFFEVAANVFQVLAIFIFLLLGFAFAFLILFNGKYPFTTIGETMSKIVIMMVELDYNGVYGGVEEEMLPAIAVLGRILYLGFVILVVMVLTNLMVGMSVTDVTELEKQGKSKRMVKKAQFLVLFEKICYKDDWFGYLPDKIHEKIKTYRTASENTVVWPNKRTHKVQNPLPAEIISSILQAVLDRDEQAEIDILNAKVDNMARDIQQIFRIVKNTSRKRDIRHNNTL